MWYSSFIKKFISKKRLKDKVSDMESKSDICYVVNYSMDVVFPNFKEKYDDFRKTRYSYISTTFHDMTVALDAIYYQRKGLAFTKIYEKYEYYLVLFDRAEASILQIDGTNFPVSNFKYKNLKVLHDIKYLLLHVQQFIYGYTNTHVELRRNEILKTKNFSNLAFYMRCLQQTELQGSYVEMSLRKRSTRLNQLFYYVEPYFKNDLKILFSKFSIEFASENITPFGVNHMLAILENEMKRFHALEESSQSYIRSLTNSKTLLTMLSDYADGDDLKALVLLDMEYQKIITDDLRNVCKGFDGLYKQKKFTLENSLIEQYTNNLQNAVDNHNLDSDWEFILNQFAEIDDSQQTHLLDHIVNVKP